MTKKQFLTFKLFVVVALSITVSISVTARNFIVPAVCMLVAFIALIFVKRRVKEVMSDERDYAVGGKAALVVMQVYALVASVGVLAFYAFRDNVPSYEPIALTLAYSVCFLLILYSILFRYYNRK